VISQVVVGLVFSWFYLPSGLFDIIVGTIGIDVSGGIAGNPNTATTTALSRRGTDDLHA
jgi:multiple sugar transport system permease protein